MASRCLLRVSRTTFRYFSKGTKSTKPRREIPPTINVTKNAAKVVSKLATQKPSIEGIRVGFDGVKYTVNYAPKDEIHALDERIDVEGATVVVDWKAFGALVGKKLDFDEDKREFVISDES
mmetsp:Transcript_2182/g.3154  ORF Transcript_2182/g.3154 Transcript_2182/m.3154 type:complete len:121 (+) Transcript_2182:1277-1639(+)